MKETEKSVLTLFGAHVAVDQEFEVCGFGKLKNVCLLQAFSAYLISSYLSYANFNRVH